MNEETGDGAKCAVIVTGELLKQANELLEEGMHPMKRVKGYRKALLN